LDGYSLWHFNGSLDSSVSSCSPASQLVLAFLLTSFTQTIIDSQDGVRFIAEGGIVNELIIEYPILGTVLFFVGCLITGLLGGVLLAFIVEAFVRARAETTESEGPENRPEHQTSSDDIRRD
jgi:hypothetical protein